MPNLENATNVNSVEINTPATGSNVVEQKSGTEPSPAETPKLSLEQRVQNLENTVKVNKQEMARLTTSVETTRSAVNNARNEVRKKLGLGPETIEEDPQSVISDKDRLKKLQDERSDLEKQKEELISQQEKEKLIKEETERVLQEKLDILSKQFKALNPNDQQSILNTGKNILGSNFMTESMGSLSPEIAQSLIKAFMENKTLLLEMLKNMPGLSAFLEKLKEDITKEATESVEKKLEAERQKIEERQVKEEKPEEELEVSEVEIPTSEIKTESPPFSNS